MALIEPSCYRWGLDEEADEVHQFDRETHTIVELWPIDVAAGLIKIGAIP